MSVRSVGRDWMASLKVQLANAVLALPSRRLRVAFCRSVLRWPMGEEVRIGRGLRLQNLRGIRLGTRVVINKHVHLDLRGGIRLGDDVAIAAYSVFLTADHDPDSPTREYRARGVSVGDRAWVATGAVVLPGTSIAEGCVVGAGAVVRGNLQEWTIYAGNPATPVRERSRSAQERLAMYQAPLH